MHTKMLNCFYDKSDSDKMIVYDEQYLSFINKNAPMPDKTAKIYQEKKASDSTAYALNISNKYRVR
jgi:hypothetical protein